MGVAARVQKQLAAHHKLVAGSAYLAACTWLSIFSSFDRKTEIEEHALLAGYAPTGIKKAEWQRQLHEVIRNVQKANTIPEALEQGFVDAELIAQKLPFSPFEQEALATTAYYTVVGSRRGDSRESLVLMLATPWSSHSNKSSKASWGVGIGLTLAKYLKTVQWMAKDVFIVFLDSSLPYGSGARAWLQEYFGGSSGVRRGVLRQAVVLDIEDKAAQLLCDVEGINGMVPNQDLVNSYVIEAHRGTQVFQREVWESVFHHFQNGGVHSNHAPFLEVQVPAFTVKARRFKPGRALAPEEIASSLEGILRDCSAVLQQLHHSFNFYFFTALQRHVSSGIYLYPVFAMMFPFLSFLMTSPAYRDVRSLLVGLGSIASIAAVSGGAIFLLGSAPRSLSKLLGQFASDMKLVDSPQTIEQLLGPQACIRGQGISSGAIDARRSATIFWLQVSLSCTLVLGLVLRRYAYTVFDDDHTFAGQTTSSQSDGPPKEAGVKLPNPLWESLRASSGFAFLVVLAPITIYSWSVAVPLTIVTVPMLVLARPCNWWRRPVRSTILLGFLVCNAFVIVATPAMKEDILLNWLPGLASLPRMARTFIEGEVAPELPQAARLYLPLTLLRWLETGALLDSLSGDLLVALYEAARDFHCVGGMLFPVFCFAYWPLLVFIALVGLILPAQRVDKDDVSLKSVLLGVLFLISLLVLAFMGGVVWRSYSSSGLGKLQW